jgi:hypothetical protein
MKWIPIEERLPTHPATYVLVAMSSGLVLSTLFCADRNYFSVSMGEKLIGDTDELSAHFSHARRYGYRVTHWMPLPEAPRAELPN